MYLAQPGLLALQFYPRKKHCPMQKAAKQKKFRTTCTQGKEVRTIVLNFGLMLEAVLTRTSFREADETPVLDWLETTMPPGL